MNEQSSSLLAREPAPAGARDVARFAARPRLPERVAGYSPSALRQVGRLFVLDMALMGLILLALVGVELAGVDIPDSELAGIELGAAWIAVIVIGAPLSEELAFRGWQSGTLGAMIGSPIAALGCFLMLGMVLAPAYAALALVGGILIAAAAGIAYWLRDKGPYRWFRAAFPLFFWAAALGFAAIHLGNYEEAAHMLWPLVVPQFLAGILFGYARVHYGLWSSVLLHALHNGTFMALVVLSESVMGGTS